MYFKFVFTYALILLQAGFVNAQQYSSELHDFNVEILADRLEHPWGMDFLPDGRVLITERTGNLKVADIQSETVQTVAGVPDIHEHGQGGLLDVLVHPQFNQNGLIYLSYAKGEGRKYGTEVLRAKFNDNEIAEVETIFSAQPKVSGTRHFGSRLVIDNNGYLFISLGDRGDRELAQQLDSHIGSLIRLHDDGTIPEDNPFIDHQDALPEIYSYGHRNIQGMTLRPDDLSLWTHEHGPQGGDELNLSAPGNNYGWPVITYGVNYGLGTKIGEGSHKQGMEQPVYYWVPSIAPSGLSFYQGDVFPNWNNSLFVGSLKFATLVRLEIQDNQVVAEERLLAGELGRIRDVTQGPDGFIYLLTDSSNGKLTRLVAP